MHLNDNRYFFGFAVRKGRDDGLLDKLNGGLEKAKKDGSYQALVQRWFGVNS
ncbi:transporter substrate-binding domain-containing protein [Suttonella ornithocola]|uniref:transporter substrate-binding domain-containing protein n=1 Tax=Suttonella ornithocola TaxID=279832 RepID=UPI003D15F747